MNAAVNTSTYAFEARHVTKKFGANVVIEDLSIGFEPGMLHSILGPNGAGKTTLFNLLTRDLPVTSGEILLKGSPVTNLKPHQIARRGVGRSYQISSVYLDLTFLENVWLAAYRAAHGGRTGWWRNVCSYDSLRVQASELLTTLGLGQYEDTLAKSVSYGDQRLLEIAVTLATRPQILLLDEIPECGGIASQLDLARPLVQRQHFGADGGNTLECGLVGIAGALDDLGLQLRDQPRAFLDPAIEQAGQFLVGGGIAGQHAFARGLGRALPLDGQADAVFILGQRVHALVHGAGRCELSPQRHRKHHRQQPSQRAPKLGGYAPMIKFHS
jgi:branched-chain amino acid transport system ATP-binding protein